jgi:hypothetical protein
MSIRVIAFDLVAILLAVIGFHMAFRQRIVRRLLGWKAAQSGAGAAEDPLRYALLIFGMMVFAFGIILFGFTTFYAMLTR